jgi:hypothetical protein
MNLARTCGYVLCFYAGLAGTVALAREQQTIGSLALRAQKSVSPRSSVDAAATFRWREGFKARYRSIFQGGFTTLVGDNGMDLNLAYQAQFRPDGSVEHRLHQQLRQRFQFATGSYDLSGRLEERYFNDGRSGNRLRVLNRWSQPLQSGNTLQLGYEWMYNLNDLNSSNLRGLNQNRLIFGLQQPLKNGARLEWELQMSFMHVTNGEHWLQNQLQLRYSFNL